MNSKVLRASGREVGDTANEGVELSAQRIYLNCQCTLGRQTEGIWGRNYQYVAHKSSLNPTYTKTNRTILRESKGRVGQL